VDNLLDEHLNVRLELFMSRIMNNLPVDMVWVKDSIYSEDWHELLSLSISNDLSTQVTKRVLHRLFQRGFKLTVKTVYKLEPFVLNLGGSVNEEIIGLHDFP
jgi:hypothetical protein